MSVELSPVELSFRRPFTQQVTQVLRLTNPGFTPIAFKVKTTAPKQYCVRPNSGRIDARQVIEVHVILQAMKEDPPPDTRCRDKFLVQSIPISADNETSNLASLWSSTEQGSRSAVQEKKIRVSYLPSVSDDLLSTPAARMNGTGSASPNDAPPSYSTPISAHKNNRGGENDTPSRAAHPAPVGPVSVPASKPVDIHHLGEARASEFNPGMTNSATGEADDNRAQFEHQQGSNSTAASKVTSSVAGIKEAVPTSMEQLEAKLAEAQATIAHLSGGGNAQGDPRQRKLVDDAKDGVKRLQQQTANNSGGVSVFLAAVLCLLSFLIAYLFL